MAARVCVVGGGIIGLSTAVRIQEELGGAGAEVTVISEEFSPNTTGDISAGFWRPYFVGSTPKDQIWRWGKETFDHLVRIGRTPDGGILGVFPITGYDIFKNPAPEEFWKDIVLSYRKMTDQELQQFPGYRLGYVYTTTMCECKKYLPWLLKRFQNNGGKCTQRKVKSFSELVGVYDVVINCTGVWAKYLVENEDDLQPLKGQLIMIKAPWVKHFVNAEDDDLYILVGSEMIALGGTHEKGKWDTSINQSERQRIWDGCLRLMPSLKNAEVVNECAGFRPGRSSVRLEKEHLFIGDQQVKVVHNYGHGGSGVTMHWGCAGDAVQLVREILQETSPENHAKL